MKKLMVALAAVATAFGLYADGPSYTFLSGSDFESGELSTIYWKSSVEGAATVVDSQHGITDAMNIKRSLQYVDSTDTKGLKIATTLGNPVTNNVESTGLPLPLEGNLCYDALVNFTVFDATDEIPAVDLADAKLAVYLQLASEADNAATNLYVYAKNGGTAQAFPCATEVTPGWHRLTIKAIKNIGGNQPGFVVFIDGAAVTSQDAQLTGAAAAALNVIAASYNKDGALFVSTSNAAEITSVCFDGQGSVDEAYFATGSVAAFTDDPATFAVKVGADITSFTATYGTTIKTWTTGASQLEFVVDASVDPQVVSIEATCTDGKFLKKTEYAVDGKDITIDDAVVAVASVGDQKFDNIAEAIAVAAGEPVVLLAAEVGAFTVDKAVTIDLNGKKIASSDAEVPAITLANGAALVIDDALTTGNVAGFGEDPVAVNIADDVSASLTIKAGQFDGMVFRQAVFGTENVSKIKISTAKNTKVNGDCALNPPTGYEFVDNKAGYFVLQALPTTFTVSATPAQNGEYTTQYKIGDGEFQNYTAAFDVDLDKTATIKYTAATGYTISAGDTVEVTKNSQVKAVPAPTFAAKAYKLNATENEYTTLTKSPNKSTYAYNEGVTLTAMLVSGDYEWDQIPTGWNTADHGVTYTLTYAILDEDVDSGNKVATPTAKAKQQGWPDPTDPELNGKTADQQFPGKIPEVLANVPAKRFTDWAKNKSGLDFATCTKEDVAALTDAYLLNCTPGEVAAMKAEAVAAIKITSITFDGEKWVITSGDYSEGTPYANAKVHFAKVTIEGADDTNAEFWQATLVPDETPANKE